jgi:DNA repair exonuclease SbcCD ATPase subunit
MKIVELTVANVKRLKAVRIKPDGNLVVIGGENGQGKTSVLDSIMYALGGKQTVCERPIHEGEKRAEVTIDLGDLTVTRTFTEAGGSLSVKKADGSKVAGPQALLDSLAGRLSFDPLDFARMEPAKQKATLQALVGLDFAGLDHERKQAFDERTAVNRRVKELEANLKAAPHHTDAPEVEVSVTDLSAELQKAQDAEVEFERRKGAYEQAKARVQQAERDLAMHDDAIGRIRKQILELEAQLERMTDDERPRLTAAIKERTLEATDAKAAAENVPEFDTDAIRGRLNSAEEVNRKVRENARRAELDAAYRAACQEADAHTDRIEKIDADKAAALQGATFPVPGLAFDEHGVTLNGLPFSQASAAEQLRVSVAMGLALNPKLRVMLIRDASLLDKKSLQLVAEMAEQHDAQVWMERVGDGAEVSVVIEDGEVKPRGLGETIREQVGPENAGDFTPKKRKLV